MRKCLFFLFLIVSNIYLIAMDTVSKVRIHVCYNPDKKTEPEQNVTIQNKTSDNIYIIAKTFIDEQDYNQATVSILQPGSEQSVKVEERLQLIRPHVEGIKWINVAQCRRKKITIRTLFGKWFIY